MKKSFLRLVFVIAIAFSMTSCYTYTVQVGKGAQTGVEVAAKNHYLVYGLAPIIVSDAQRMAGGAENYNVTVTHTFFDGFLAALTSGLYTPTTTIVTK